MYHYIFSFKNKLDESNLERFGAKNVFFCQILRIAYEIKTQLF